jgi:hypothetical protein
VGAKSSNRRNFESGFVTTDPETVQAITEQFDQVWMGAHCKACQRKRYCASYPELLARMQAGS